MNDSEKLDAIMEKLDIIVEELDIIVNKLDESNRTIDDNHYILNCLNFELVEKNGRKKRIIK